MFEPKHIIKFCLIMLLVVFMTGSGSLAGDGEQMSNNAELTQKNLVDNGDFSYDLLIPTDSGADVINTEGTWQLALNTGSAAGAATLEDGKVKLDITAGAGGYSIQLLQAPVILEKGASYSVSIDGRSDTGGSAIQFTLGGGADAGWAKYLQKTFAFTTITDTYETTFDMELNTNENTRLEIWILDNAVYYLDNIKLYKTAEVKPGDIAEPGTKTEADEDLVEDWILVWEDNFTSIDSNIWTFQNGNGQDFGLTGWGNNELEYYQPENASIETTGLMTNGLDLTDSSPTDDSYLVITAKDISDNPVKDEYGEYNYTSSKLISTPDPDKGVEGKQMKYGRVEVRAMLPEGQGIWPAIWMLGDDGNSWPDCGEIDIMELVGNKPTTVHGTLHTGYKGAYRSIGKGYTLESGKFSDGFHIFALEWDEDELEWYVDDTLYHVANRDEVTEKYWTFDDPFHFLLNVAVGGNWPGSPDETTVFPQFMAIDYIRVYEDTNPDSIDGEEVWECDYVEPGNPVNEPDIGFVTGTEDPEYYFIADNPTLVDILYGNDPNSIDGDITLDTWGTGTPLTKNVTFEGKNCWELTTSGSWGTVVAFMGDVYSPDAPPADFPADVSTFNTIEISLAASDNNTFTDMKVKFAGPEEEFSLANYGFDPTTTGWQIISIPLSDFNSIDLSTVSQIAVFALGGEAGIDKFYITDFYLKTQ